MDRETHVVKQVGLLVSQGLLAEAQEALATALERYPDNGRLWRLRGIAAHRQADFTQARAAFEHAGLLVPLDGRTQCLLADAYARSGSPHQARRLLTLLAADAGTDVDVLPLVAAGLGYLGDFDEALAVCRSAAECEPECPEAQFAIAYYLRRLGYPAAAILAPLARAFELSPDQLLYRSNLAFLLDELGRREEAYDLLRDLSLDVWPCVCGLRRMKTLFQAMGDFGRWEACTRRLREIRGCP